MKQNVKLWLMIASVALLIVLGSATLATGLVLWLAFDDEPGWQRKQASSSELAGPRRRGTSQEGSYSNHTSSESHETAASESERAFLGLEKREWKDLHLVSSLAAVGAAVLHVGVNMAWMKGSARYVLNAARSFAKGFAERFGRNSGPAGI